MSYCNVSSLHEMRLTVTSSALKKGHSTGLCTYMLKQSVEYYTLGGSNVFLCFVDFSKAYRPSELLKIVQNAS